MSDLALKRTILQLEKRLAFLERNTAAPGVRRRQSGTTPPWFWGRITSVHAGSGEYDFDSAKLVAGSWASKTTAEGGISGTVNDQLYRSSAYQEMPIGTPIQVYIVNNMSGGNLVKYFACYGIYNEMQTSLLERNSSGSQIVTLTTPSNPVIIAAVGAGGGGGGCGNTNYTIQKTDSNSDTTDFDVSCGGGGGGGSGNCVVTSVILGQGDSLKLTIGTGGAGGANGTYTGTDGSDGTITKVEYWTGTAVDTGKLNIQANGGEKGTKGDYNQPGDGGVYGIASASGSLVNYHYDLPGGAGGNGMPGVWMATTTNVAQNGGFGGKSPFGAPDARRGTDAPDNPRNGGGGRGGGGYNAFPTFTRPKNGDAGYVIIWY